MTQLYQVGAFKRKVEHIEEKVELPIVLKEVKHEEEKVEEKVEVKRVVDSKYLGLFKEKEKIIIEKKDEKLIKYLRYSDCLLEKKYKKFMEEEYDMVEDIYGMMGGYDIDFLDRLGGEDGFVVFSRFLFFSVF